MANRSPRGGIGLAILLAGQIASACGGSPGATETAPTPCPSVTPAPAADVSLLPADLPMDEWGTITRVNRQQGFLGAKAVGDLQIVELYPEMVRRLMAEDYSFLGGENEGFEAELVFSRPRGQLVSFTLREGCDGHVEIRTLIEKGGKQA